MFNRFVWVVPEYPLHQDARFLLAEVSYARQRHWIRGRIRYSNEHSNADRYCE